MVEGKTASKDGSQEGRLVRSRANHSEVNHGIFESKCKIQQCSSQPSLAQPCATRKLRSYCYFNTWLKICHVMEGRVGWQRTWGTTLVSRAFCLSIFLFQASRYLTQCSPVFAYTVGSLRLWYFFDNHLDGRLCHCLIIHLDSSELSHRPHLGIRSSDPRLGAFTRHNIPCSVTFVQRPCFTPTVTLQHLCPHVTPHFSMEKEYIFPSDKLQRLEDESRTPLVLISCGSFSPITYLHLRMFEMCKDWVKENTNFEVVAGYLSPVADAYQKQGLTRAEHRIEMCSLASAESGWIMVDPWEAMKPDYTRTALVLDHFQHEINEVRGGVDMGNGKAAAKILLMVSTVPDPVGQPEHGRSHL